MLRQKAHPEPPPTPLSIRGSLPMDLDQIPNFVSPCRANWYKNWILTKISLSIGPFDVREFSHYENLHSIPCNRGGAGAYDVFLRFTYDAYTIAGIEIWTDRTRIPVIFALHTTLVPLHELKCNLLGRTFRSFTLCIRRVYHCMKWNISRSCTSRSITLYIQRAYHCMKWNINCSGAYPGHLRFTYAACTIA